MTKSGVFWYGYHHEKAPRPSLSSPPYRPACAGGVVYSNPAALGHRPSFYPLALETEEVLDRRASHSIRRSYRTTDEVDSFVNKPIKSFFDAQ